MTSTNFTVGMPESGRPSSRVLAPPGGKSSIVFCDSKSGMEDTLAIGRQNRKNQQNSALMNEIFGTSDPNVRYGANRVSEDAGGDVQDSLEEPQDTLMTEGQDVQSELGDRCDDDSQKEEDVVSIRSTTSRTSLRPPQEQSSEATGAPAGPAQPRKRVPPGGYSSGLW